MRTTEVISDAITRKIYYGLLHESEPESSVEFLLALDGIEGGIGASPSGLPGVTQEAQAVDDLLGAVSRDCAAGFLLSTAGYLVTDPDERTKGGLPTAVFRVVMEFKIERALDSTTRFPEVINGAAGVVLSAERSQGTISEAACNLTVGEKRLLRQAGLSVVP
jgi:hypothetical protein